MGRITLDEFSDGLKTYMEELGEVSDKANAAFASVGNLNELQTSNKESLIGAMNELYTNVENLNSELTRCINEIAGLINDTIDQI